jgi:hypothetical protein
MTPATARELRLEQRYAWMRGRQRPDDAVARYTPLPRCELKAGEVETGRAVEAAAIADAMAECERRRELGIVHRGPIPWHSILVTSAYNAEGQSAGLGRSIPHTPGGAGAVKESPQSGAPG